MGRIKTATMSIDHRRLLLIDFDRTIFDSDGFYRFILSNTPSKHVRENWDSLYLNYQSKFKTMNIFTMLSSHLDPVELKKLKSLAAKAAPRYIYSDVDVFFEHLKLKNVNFKVFTYGDYEFQLFKINSSGIGSIPNLITSIPKHLHPVMNNQCVIIDDNPFFIEQIINNDIDVIRMTRPNSKYTSYAVKKNSAKSVKNLSEVLNYYDQPRE